MVTKITRRNSTMVKLNGSRVVLCSKRESIQAQSQKLEDKIRKIDQTLLWAVEQVDIPEDGGGHIAHIIREGKGRCMSDSSLKDNYGSSTFTLMTSDKHKEIGRRNMVLGMDIDQFTCRSKICGVFGNLLLVNAICTYHNIIISWRSTK